MKRSSPHPCLSSLIYLFEKSARPSLESRQPILSHVSLLALLRLPVKCQRPPFPSRKATLELTAFSNVGLLFTILLACSGFNIMSSAIRVPAAAGGAISQHGLHYTPPISNRFFHFFSSSWGLILFDYNMVPGDRNYASAPECSQPYLACVTHLTFCDEAY